MDRRCRACGASEWKVYRDGKPRCLPCARYREGWRWIHRRERIEQAIARGELLEDIAVRLGVTVKLVYQVADQMDAAHREGAAA